MLSPSIHGDGWGWEKYQACDVLHGHHMCVAGPTCGDARFSEELPRPGPVDDSNHAVIALSTNLHLTGQQEVHRRRSFTLLNEVGAGREPFDVDEISCISERRRLS